MFGMVKYVKNRLSHVRSRSWHYRMVSTVWSWRAGEGKACTYYWVKIPSSFVMFCFYGVLFAIATIFGFFIGRVMTYFKASDPDLKWMENSGELYYPYKTLPNGRRIPVAPWEIAVPLGLLAGTYYLAFINTIFGMWMALGLTSLALLVLVIFLLYRTEGVRTAVWLGVVDIYNKACPPLVVEDNNK